MFESIKNNQTFNTFFSQYDDSTIIGIIIIVIICILYILFCAITTKQSYVTKFCNSSIEKFTNNIIGFNSSIERFSQDVIGIKPIIPNGKYYGLECQYTKDDTFYDSLKQNGFTTDNDILNACLIVPCSYDDTDKELMQLNNQQIKNNVFGDSVRIFMINNSDFMVSKLKLYQVLKDTYGLAIVETIMPKTWDLTDKNQISKFENDYNKNTIYITKNNNQRQEGINIHTNLNEIVTSNKLLVQELLQNPYCINGHKINLRVYCLVICDNNKNAKIQIYNDGFMYYTSEKFIKGNPSFNTNITTGYIDRKIYDNNPLTHNDFRKYLDNNGLFSGRTLSPVEQYLVNNNQILSDYVFSQIYHLLKFSIQPFLSVLGDKSIAVSFQLYGADIAISDDLKPMLMEINKGPDLGAKDVKDKTLKVNMCSDMLNSVGLVSSYSKNNFITVFEQVNIGNNVIELNNYVDMVK